MKSLFRGCLLLVLSYSITGYAQSPQPMEIGIIPYLSTRGVLTTFKPLRQYLEKQLNQPVYLYTAPDLKTFVRRTQEGAYDLVITAANLGRLAQREKGYIPLFVFKRDVISVVVVPKKDTIKDVSALKGQTVVIPDQLSMVTMLGLQWLEEQGLSKKDFRLRHASSNSTAVASVRRGESAAAITALVALEQMPAELKNSVRVLASTGKFHNLMILANPKLSADQGLRVKSALWEFAHKTKEGKEFLNQTGFQGIKALGEGELKTLDRFIPETKKLLEAS